jgi:3-phenylpropionate/trans-cinnamate dioxygenase ferredoxin reductase subunit
VGQRHIVVVGGSLAGLRTVEALRRLGDDARLTLVGAEEALPYDRPPLSKDVLLGKAEPEAVALTTAAALEALGVEVHLGVHATGLDVGARRLAVGQDSVRFDELVVATGAHARRPAFAAPLDGVHLLRTLDDAVAIRTAFEQAPRVVVIGGGFVGAEVASSARALGLDVTVVDIAPVLMERGLGPVIGARMSAIASAAGVRLCLGVGVDRIEGADRVEEVVLTDGARLPADLVVIGVGAAPTTEWLTGSGLRIDDGVVCDEFLAAAPGVHAVGDVSRPFHPHYGRHLRLEHWTAAGEQADALAATLSGAPTAYDAIPYVWSDQFGHKLQIAGVPDPRDEVRFLLDTPEKFVAIAGRDGLQRAAFALDAPGALVRQRMKLTASPPWPPALDRPTGRDEG